MKQYIATMVTFGNDVGIDWVMGDNEDSLLRQLNAMLERGFLRPEYVTFIELEVAVNGYDGSPEMWITDVWYTTPQYIEEVANDSD